MFPFYNPLKTPENQRFSGIFRWYKVGTLPRNGLNKGLRNVFADIDNLRNFRNSQILLKCCMNNLRNETQSVPWAYLFSKTTLRKETMGQVNFQETSEIVRFYWNISMLHGKGQGIVYRNIWLGNTIIIFVI